MATPLPSGTTETDPTTLLALRDLADYTAVNPAYCTEALVALDEELKQAAAATLRARTALAAARDAEITAAHRLHTAVLGAKAAVVAQYGADSPAVQAIGLKKKSEYRRPARRRRAE